MKTITATDFQNRSVEILHDVTLSGKAVLITRRGKPVVRLEPIQEKQPAVQEKREPIRLGTMAGTAIILGDIVSPVFNEWETIGPYEDHHRNHR